MTPTDPKGWLFMGGDPGASGGLAVLDYDGRIVSARARPEQDEDFAALVKAFAVGARARVEQVASSPQMGVGSAFTFGGSYRSMTMALICHGVPFELVKPAVWQRALDCFTEGDKNVTKRLAQQKWPHFKVTHATADALLLAEYCRRVEIARARAV